MRRSLALMFTVILGLLGLAAVNEYYRAQVDKENRWRLEEVRDDVAGQFADQITIRLSSVRDLQAFLLSREELPTEEEFNRYAKTALSYGPEVRALQYADADRVIRYIYPLEGNEEALGLDLDTRESAVRFVNVASEERRLSVANPAPLVQGPLGVVARAPLYRDDEFLGLAQGVFEVEPIVAAAVGNNRKDFVFHFYDSDGSLFWGEGEPKETAEEAAIPLGDRHWSVNVAWASNPPGPSFFVLALIWGLGGAFLLSLLFIVNRIYTQTDLLRAQVAEKTLKLSEANAALSSSELLYRDLFRNAREGIISASGEGKVTSINPAGAKILGFKDPQDVIGFDVDKFYSEQSERQRLFEALDKHDYVENFEVVAVRAGSNGEKINLFGSAIAEKDAEGNMVGYQAFFTDITERRHAIEALKKSEERLTLALEGAELGLWDFNIKADNVFINEGFMRLLGYDELANKRISRQLAAQLISPEDRLAVREAFSRHLDGKETSFEAEFRLKRKDGTLIWVLSRGRVAERNDAGEPLRAAGTLLDITARRFAEVELERAAYYDALTGLPNRTFFTELLNRAISRAHRHGEHFSLLFLDLDRFKNINDTLGHMAGDKLLEVVAQRLKESVREVDAVARLGGDEFVVLLDELHAPAEVTHVTDRILNFLRQPMIIEGMEFFPSASVGIVISSTGYSRTEDVLRDADTAMYRAKEKGRGRFEIFDDTMRESLVQIVETENGLRNALANNEFELHYQPIVNTKDLRIHHFEALLRWRSPDRGLVPPDHFIPIAEDSGLILPIGEWVIREACRQITEWSLHHHGNRKLGVSVNISVKQFSRSDVYETVRAALEECNCPPEMLHLEITESVFLEEPEGVLEEFNKIRALGVGIHLDDFGTGYSSLGYLHRFPMDCIKIDRSFIASIPATKESQEIIRAIIVMAAEMKMGVVAEGVEVAEQLHLLRNMGCGYAQGFYFSRPLPAAQLEELLNSQWNNTGDERFMVS